MEMMFINFENIRLERMKDLDFLKEVIIKYKTPLDKMKSKINKSVSRRHTDKPIHPVISSTLRAYIIEKPLNEKKTLKRF